MKAFKSIVGAVVLATSLTTYAQQSSISASSPAAPLTATGQSTTAIEAQQPAQAKQWSGLIVNETEASVKEIRALNSAAPVLNTTSAFLYYKLNDTYKLGVGQIFAIANNRENAAAGSTIAVIHGGEGKAFEMWTTPVTLGIKTKQTLLNSDALSYTLRMDLPTGRYYREVKKMNGILRMDVTPTWHAGTKVDLSVGISPRITLNSSGNNDQSVASDGIARLVLAPSASYIFNDKLSSYYTYTMDLRSTKVLNRATAELDKLNLGIHEVGMNINAGNFTINPALTSAVDMNNGSASLMTSDARAFSMNDNGYYLGVVAAF